MMSSVNKRDQKLELTLKMDLTSVKSYYHKDYKEIIICDIIAENQAIQYKTNDNWWNARLNEEGIEKLVSIVNLTEIEEQEGKDAKKIKENLSINKTING